MKIRELIAELKYLDFDKEVMVVEQPNYPLVAAIDRVEVRDKIVYIHLDSAYDYYGDEDEDTENEENETED